VLVEVAGEPPDPGVTGESVPPHMTPEDPPRAAMSVAQKTLFREETSMLPPAGKMDSGRPAPLNVRAFPAHVKQVP
jgi:hypothetical protein